MSETATETTTTTTTPEWKPPTREEFEKRIAEEFGKGKRLGSEAAAIAKQERERLSELEKFQAERLAADKKAEEEKAVAKGDFEKARQQIIDSAAEAERKKWQPLVEERDTRLKRLEGRVRGTVRDKIMAAAGPTAYSATQVADLLDRRVRLNDELEPEVLDENGEPALVAGKPMSIQQLVEGYLQANPNLVKSSGGKGGGAGGGASLNGAADQGELAAAQKAVDDAAKKFQETRNANYLTVHRQAVKALNDLKAKNAAK